MSGHTKEPWKVLPLSEAFNPYVGALIAEVSGTASAGLPG
jgi:hypothetical protein